MSAWRTWLQPGMRVKRWGTLAFFGLAGMVLSVAVGLVWAYRSYYFQLQSEYPILRPLTLQFVPHPWREVVLLVAGLAIAVFAATRLNQSLLAPLMAREASGRALAQIVAEHRFGPAQPAFGVVAVGGGTGLSSLLRGLKHHDAGITAIVTVADDGGSTGRLRAEFDIPAPGDIRNCIAALADDEALVTRLFQHRFQGDGSTLSGHSFGNLFITALTRTTGSFERAVEEASEVLNIRGRVLPATLENVRLSAEMTDGTILHGESSVGEHGPRGKRIGRMFLTPRYPEAHAPALGAILNADLIVLGPGQPVHQRRAQPARRRDPGGDPLVGGDGGLRLQRRDAAGRDRRLRRRRPRPRDRRATSGRAGSMPSWSTPTRPRSSRRGATSRSGRSSPGRWRASISASRSSRGIWPARAQPLAARPGQAGDRADGAGPEPPGPPAPARSPSAPLRRIRGWLSSPAALDPAFRVRRRRA